MEDEFYMTEEQRIQRELEKEELKKKKLQKKADRKNTKAYKIIKRIIIAALILFAVYLVFICIFERDRIERRIKIKSLTKRKPVIYLYPEETTEICVKLDYKGEFIVTYPSYGDGWNVTAEPDGTLTDASGKKYNYLYWEGKDNCDYDMSEGFCVKGSDTAGFLEEALEKLGLTRREANEFIVYWLPLMEGNAYNVISFQKEAYTDCAVLHVSPEPDTVIRVFMAYYPSEKAVDIPAQQLTATERVGFTVVEWGGSKIAK